MMKRIFGALMGCLIASAAMGQAQVGPGNVLGNTTAARAPAADSSVTLLLDRALGSTRGSIIERGASGWAIVGPGTTGKPWVSGGAGADPSYATLGIVGGGTNCAAASGTCLDNITGFASNGYIKRTGAGTYSQVATVPIADGGTGQGSAATAISALMPTPTRAGDVAYWNGSNWVTLAGNNSGTQFFSENSSGVPAWAAGSGVTSVVCGTGLDGGTITSTGTCSLSAARRTLPTRQIFTSGTAATYTAPANVLWLRIRMVGGGGGGCGSGTSPGSATAGTSSTFTGSGTTNTTLTGTAGTNCSANAAGTGAIATGSASDVLLTGANGGPGAGTAQTNGGAGGISCYGSGGIGGVAGGGGGSVAGPNSGSGGGGGGVNATVLGGGGGASGACAERFQLSPSATYTYTVGAGGSAGTAGTGGAGGGNGAAGLIIVEEFYN